MEPSSENSVDYCKLAFHRNVWCWLDVAIFRRMVDLRWWIQQISCLNNDCVFWNDVHSLQETYEQKRSQHLAELQRKEDEMRQMFVVRVKEKESELKEAEKEVSCRWNCFLFSSSLVHLLRVKLGLVQVYINWNTSRNVLSASSSRIFSVLAFVFQLICVADVSSLSQSLSCLLSSFPVSCIPNIYLLLHDVLGNRLWINLCHTFWSWS